MATEQASFLVSVELQNEIDIKLKDIQLNHLPQALIETQILHTQKTVLNQLTHSDDANAEDIQNKTISIYYSLIQVYQKQLLECQQALLSILNETTSPEPQQIQCESNQKEDSAWGTEVFSSWDENTSGGCMNYPSWRKNRQIFLKLEKAGEVTINLTQLPSDDQSNQGAGFYVLPGNNLKNVVISENNLIAKSAFSKNDTVSCAVNLEPSPNGYVIIPTTFFPNLGLNYQVTIESENTGAQIKLATEADCYRKLVAHGEWSGKSAGGCRNFSSWVYNPQYYLSVDKLTTFQLVITQDIEDFDAIGVYIFKANEGKSKSVPKELLFKSTFGGEKESCIAFEADSDCIVLPCTFHSGKESKFEMTIYTDNTRVTLEPITDTHEVSVDGEWDDETAGGCTSYSSWRNNPQYVIKSSTKTDIALRLVQVNESEDENKQYHPVGIYVFADTGRKRLLVKPADVVTSCPCSNREAIDLNIPADKLQRNGEFYSVVVMPCTFYPDLKSKFKLSAFTSAEAEKPTISVYPNFFKQSISSKWDESNSGGCLNHASSWRKNQQYEIKARKDAKVIILLNIPNMDPKPSLGFYLFKSKSDSSKVLDLNQDEILKKAPFRKSNEAYCPFTIHAGESYNLMPCSFAPGIYTDYTLSIFSNEDDVVSINPVEEPSVLSFEGSWKGITAGGCLNNDGWWFNPRFALQVKQKFPISVVLFQKNSGSSGNLVNIRAIGFNVARSDENMNPVLGAFTDLIASSPYEVAIDVSLPNLELEGSDKPYILTPSTFYPNEEGDFAFNVYFPSSQAANVSFLPLPTVEIVDNIEEPTPIIAEQPSPDPVEAHKPIPVEVSNPTVVQEPEPVPSPAPQPVQAVAVVEQPLAPVQPPTPPVDIHVVPPVPKLHDPAKAPPPPKSFIGEISSVPASPAPNQSVSDLLQQIQEKKFLRKITEADKSNYLAVRKTAVFQGFNVEKIIARRRFLEESDDDEPELSDHEDDDDWW